MNKLELFNMFRLKYAVFVLEFMIIKENLHFNVKCDLKTKI